MTTATAPQGAAASAAVTLTLVRPAAHRRGMYLAMVADYEAVGEGRYAPLVEVLKTGFAGYVRHVSNWSLGLNLKAGWVPCTVYWSVMADIPIVVGELHIRHWLTSSSEHEGGHIGYTNAPSMRRKGAGYAADGPWLGEGPQHP